MNKELTLEVPFVYRVAIVKPRCRKPSDAYVRTLKKLTIKCFDKFPKAMKVRDEVYYWANNTLWVPVDNKCNVDFEHMTWDKLKDCTEKRGRTDSPSHLPDQNSPFFKFWQIHTGRIYDESAIEMKAFLNFREMIIDEEEVTFQEAIKIANDLCVHKGKVYRKAEEPYYQVTHSLNMDTSIDVYSSEYHYGRTDSEYIFNANELEMAKKKAEETINKFSDQNISMIEVYLPESVKIKPKYEAERLSKSTSELVDVVFTQSMNSIGVWNTELSSAKSIDAALSMAKKENDFRNDVDLQISAYTICAETGSKDELYTLVLDKAML